jgi:hypothetical protein
MYARRAYVSAEYRTWLAQRVAPILTRHGLDRQSGGSARTAVRAGVPGDERAGFPAGSLPSDGMPGLGPTGATPPADPPTEPGAAEQLSLL